MSRPSLDAYTSDEDGVSHVALELNCTRVSICSCSAAAAATLQKNVQKYEGAREVDAMLAFLKEKAHTPFEVPVKDDKESSKDEL